MKVVDEDTGEEIEIEESHLDEDLSLVKAIIATCAKCGGAVSVGVKDSMDRAMARRYGKLLEDGCEIHTTNIIVARTMRWCGQVTPCEGMWPKKARKKKTT